jgi:hypothetical protein
VICDKCGYNDHRTGDFAHHCNTQASQQVPTAMMDEDIVTLACKHNLPNGAIWEDWYSGDNMMVRPQLVAFARTLLGQSAPANAEDAREQRRFIEQDDFDNLIQVNANFEEAEGYMVSKEVMKRLAELGAVGSSGFGRYFITAFGSWLIDQDRTLPLRTVEEFNRREHAGFELYNKEGFDGTAWVNLKESVRHDWRERAALAAKEQTP